MVDVNVDSRPIPLGQAHPICICAIQREEQIGLAFRGMLDFKRAGEKPETPRDPLRKDCLHLVAGRLQRQIARQE
jgi:hypothetical protein